MSIAGKASQLYSGFSPQSLPNCVLWLDANDVYGNSIRPANGTSITAWTDKSGTSNHASNVAGYPRAVYTSNQLNGLGGLRFDGSSTYVLSNVINPGTALSGYVVGQADTHPVYAPESGNLITCRGSTSNHGAFYMAIKSDNHLAIVNTSDAPYAANAGPRSTLTNYVISTAFNGSTITARLNGSNLATTAFSGTAKTNLAVYIGNNYFLGAFNGYGHKGFVNEIILFSDAHSDTQRQQVEAYLAAKWGLSNSLPATHPYRRVPLFLRPFHPLDFSNCALWLDAADQRTITLSGTTLTGWTDKSGNNRSITINSAPTYSTTGFNGRPAMVFTLGNRITTTTASALGQNATMAAVFRVTSLGSANGVGVAGILSVGGVGTDYAIHFRNDFATYATYSPSAGGTGNDFYTAINTDIAAVAVMNTATPYWVLTLNGNNKINGGLGGYNTAPSSLTNTAVELAGGTWSTGNFGGSIAEVIIFSNSLTTAQRQQLEGYLTQKWGLRGNLPANHTFRLYSPLALPFTPLQIADCALWLDAADASTFTFSSGSNVTVWSNKTSRTDSLSTWDTGANPVRVSRGNLGLSGLPTVQFGVYGYTSNSLGYSGATPETICLVANNSSTSVYTGLTRWSGNSWAGSHVLNVRADRVRPEFQGIGGINFDVSTNPKIAISVATSSNLSIFESGTGSVSNPLTMSLNQANGNLRIGNGGGVTNEIGEVLYYSRALTTAERQAIEGYLSQKWGARQNMISTHPFKTIAA